MELVVEELHKFAEVNGFLSFESANGCEELLVGNESCSTDLLLVMTEGGEYAFKDLVEVRENEAF